MILNPANKKPDSDDEKRGEDWELVSGSKSLTSQNEGKKNEEEEEKDENWYKTLPVTPTNTPVDTPSAPTYPSQQDASFEGVNLPSIKEDVAEDQPPPPPFEEEFTPSSSEDEIFLSSVESAVNAVLAATGRVFLYIIVFVALKWISSSVWRKVKALRASQ